MSMTEFFEPRISADTKAYWDGCREHKLMVQKCKGRPSHSDLVQSVFGDWINLVFIVKTFILGRCYGK